MRKNPEAGRNILYNLDKKTSLWLQKNDRVWYDKNSPPATYASINWKEKDRYCLTKVKEAIEILKSEIGKPKLLSLGRVVRITGLNTLLRKNAGQNMPLTMSYLAEHLETVNDWRKRKIKWAVQEMYDAGRALSFAKIQLMSSVSKKYFEPLKDYVQECIDEVLRKEI